MRLSILIFDGLTALDAIGGYEVLSRIPGMETEFVGKHRGIVVADTRSLGLVAFRTFEEVKQTDILYVPGGPGGQALETDRRLPGLCTHARQSFDVDGRHLQRLCVARGGGPAQGPQDDIQLWFYRDRLKDWGAEFVPARYHRDGKYITGAGVSAAIDTGLYVAQHIGGELLAKTLQLGIEYYPAPPFSEKSPTEAPAASQQMVQQFERTGGKEQLRQQPVFQGSYEVLSDA